MLVFLPTMSEKCIQIGLVTLSSKVRGANAFDFLLKSM